MSTKVQELVEAARALTADERRELITELEKQPEPERPPILEAERIALIRSVCGKYAHLPTSSEDFIRRKQEEIDIENRRW